MGRKAVVVLKPALSYHAWQCRCGYINETIGRERKTCRSCKRRQRVSTGGALVVTKIDRKRKIITVSGAP